MTNQLSNTDRSHVAKIWERFSHRFTDMHCHVTVQGDSTSTFQDYQTSDRAVPYGKRDVRRSLALLTIADLYNTEDQTIDRKGRLISRPDGLVEFLSAETDTGDRAIEVFSFPEPLPASHYNALPPSSQVCEDCSTYDFSHLFPGIMTSKRELDKYKVSHLAFVTIDRPDHLDRPFHKNFVELQQSAKSCAACAVFLSALPQPDSFKSDDSRPIVLHAEVNNDNGSGPSLRYIDVGFPASDARHPGCQVTTYGSVDVVAANDDKAAGWPFGIAGRQVQAAGSSHQVRRWIEKCQKTHTTCQTDSSKQTLPKSVIYIPSDDSVDPCLEDGNGREGDYVALSYRWGTDSLRKTVSSKVSEHNKRLPFDNLSKTIQQAIIMTRKLGYKYLWVDCLCIMQDSPEEWQRESARMATIYQNATLTLSASVSESADHGLFYPNRDDYQVRLQARSIDGTIVIPFSIAFRSCSSFDMDVNNGVLSKRGWCLQERLLSRRIVHFGVSQTHWECLAGAWSASHSRKLSLIDAELRRDFQTVLQKSIPRKGPASLLMPGARVIKRKIAFDRTVSVKPKPVLKTTPQPPLKQLYDHEPHGTWYRMLIDYSARDLTKSTDKLAAIAGLTSTFAMKTGDIYLNGLWLHGLPEGLLWSSNGLGRSKTKQLSYLSSPPSCRAPTWSWASLDGPVIYPIGKYSYVDAVVHAYSMPGKSHLENCGSGTDNDILGLVPFQRLILKATIKPLEKIRGFKPEQRKFLQDIKDSRETILTPHASWDAPDYEQGDIEGVMAVFIAQVGCGNANCNHDADCAAGLSHCLLVKRTTNQGEYTFRRLGIAQCYSGEFTGQPKIFVNLV